jgi:Tfp pilus assembly protein PilX
MARSPQTSPRRRARREESGIALLITVVLILLFGILVLTSIGHSGDESAASARARSTSRALHAADGGMQLALNHVTQEPPDTTPIDITVGALSVQSRTRGDATPQALTTLGSGAPPEGYGINMGSGYVSELFRVDITSSGTNGSTAELQSKVYRFAGNSGGY